MLAIDIMNPPMSESKENNSSRGELALSDAQLIASPITLPCGRVLRNRLVKAAMYEHLSTFSGGPPNLYHLALYSRWARGGWGMIVTGNCLISASHLTLGRDMILHLSASDRDLDAFRALSAAMNSRGVSDSESVTRTLAIIQLNHAGRQSPRFLGGRLGTFRKPLAPSSRRVGADSKEGWMAKMAYKFLFQTPQVISSREVEELIDEFASAAKLASQTGFDGVQLHAAHGYILSQFLSPRVSPYIHNPAKKIANFVIKLNTRVDEYSDPLLLIRQIIDRIRTVVPCDFVLGIKLNAGDYVAGGLSERDALEHVRLISLSRVDYIEISGGDYENPDFMASSSPRQAFFSSFSRLVVQALPSFTNKASPLIMLTGSLRTPSQFSNILCQGHAHLLGIGRLSVLCPDLPHQILPPSPMFGSDHKGPETSPKFPLPEPAFATPLGFPKLLGAGVSTAWYVVGMRRLARGGEVDLQMGSVGALFWMWVWAGPHGLAGPVMWILGILGIVLILLTGYHQQFKL